MGLVFQYPEYQLFEETVYKDIAFGPTNMGLDAAEIDRRIRDAARCCGGSAGRDAPESRPLSFPAARSAGWPSPGVLAMEPEVLILDEPTAGLDPRGRDDILETIRTINKAQGTTVHPGFPQHGRGRPQTWIGSM